MNSQQSNMKEQVIWEEKNSAAPLQNCENNQTIVPNDTTNEIKNKFVKGECNDTGKKWVKKCPECGGEMSYSTIWGLNRSIRENCKHGNGCRALKPPTKEGWVKHCPECNGLQKYGTKKSLDAALVENKICQKCTQALRKAPTPENGWVRVCENCQHEDKYLNQYMLTAALKRSKYCQPCNKILGDKKWERKCPGCDSIIKYLSFNGYLVAIKNNSKCKKCNRLSKKELIPDGGWSKNCPECGELQTYTTKISLKNALGRNTICNDCIHKKYKILPTKENCSRTCPSCNELITHTGKYAREDCRKAIKKNSKCQDCNNKLYSSYWVIRYNPRACEFMDNYGKINGYMFQHAINANEYQVGRYFLDGYDKEKNVVFEYDEQHHFKGGKLIPKDMIRQSKIIDLIRPTAFFRYNEPNKILTEVISGKEIKL